MINKVRYKDVEYIISARAIRNRENQFSIYWEIPRYGYYSLNPEIANHYNLEHIISNIESGIKENIDGVLALSEYNERLAKLGFVLERQK